MAGMAGTQVTGGPAIALNPGKLYALGATVSQKGDIHWVAEGRTADAPLNVYLMLEGSQGMVIDTSFPIIGETVMQQLGQFPIDELKLVYTRAAEYDSIGNADLMVNKYRVTEIWSHFYAWDWTYFRTMEAIPFPPPFETKIFGVDGEIRIGKDRVLETVNAKLKLLAAAWGYDAPSKTLFTSDSFSHVLAPAPGVRQVTDKNDATTLDDVLGHFRAKFRWMEGARTAPMAEFVAHVFDRFDVEHIAPSMGCVISGRRLVRRHRDLVIEALGVLAQGEGHG